MVAAGYGHRTIVQRLVDARADVNIQEGIAELRDGDTALIMAVINDRHETVQRLIDARADVNIKGDDGCAFPRPSGRCRERPPVADAPFPPCPAGTQRCTMRRLEAIVSPETAPFRCSSAGPTRPSRTTKGTLCRPQPGESDGRTASARSVQANASASRKSTLEVRQVRRRGGRGAAADIAPLHARARSSLLHAMNATHALPQHGVPRLRSSAYAEAVAARCASHGARSAAAVGRQRVVREHTALPRKM
jgi:hypothetical protein